MYPTTRGVKISSPGNFLELIAKNPRFFQDIKEEFKKINYKLLLQKFISLKVA